MLGTCHAAQSPSEQKPEETDFSFHNKIVVKSIYARYLSWQIPYVKKFVVKSIKFEI
jgi:hypothetical protein